jgi:hypothetical protein
MDWTQDDLWAYENEEYHDVLWALWHAMLDAVAGGV